MSDFNEVFNHIAKYPGEVSARLLMPKGVFMVWCYIEYDEERDEIVYQGKNIFGQFGTSVILGAAYELFEPREAW